MNFDCNLFFIIQIIQLQIYKYLFILWFYQLSLFIITSVIRCLPCCFICTFISYCTDTLAFCGGINTSLQNKYSSFLTLHITHISYLKILLGHPILGEKSEIFFKKSLSKNGKIHEKVVTHFVEFIESLIKWG